VAPNGKYDMTSWMVERSLLDPQLSIPQSTRLSGSAALEIHRLFKERYQGLWRFLRSLGVPPDSIDDAVQQVFLVFAERHAVVAKGSEGSFLFGTAVRIAHVVKRGHRRETPADVELAGSPAPSVDELTDQKRARQVLDWMLDQIEPDQRTVFVLYEIEGLTLPEIADVLQIPVGTATSRLRRGRERFSGLVNRYALTHGTNGGKSR
jgi:RNA polymerase sigma-70 factor (ECF subfamily)